ncbi:tetratricopeptide repeat-containing sensor histidine kinase [Tenacibaculum discolor]|uniref:tetratricopeptide repeat-containing sensor histidine kinase n=1 Tax=Tenacibaculum discolor TaxID=361581 RepID=UPI000EAD3F78|nr:tetratricopeptide repeat protein [Tenacibaculum discolor]RLK03052.1 tetratricopeptide repeat protein [Tenacibaculum discolor]
MKNFLCFIFFCSTFLFSQEKSNLIDSIKGELIESGRQAYFTKKLPLLTKITLQVDSLYQKTNDSILLAKYFHFKALQNKLTYTNDSAFYYYHQSKDISKRINDSLAIGRRLLSLAILQRDAKDYRGSEISLIEALQYLEPIQHSIYLERVYNALGLVSEELNQQKDALKYYDKAIFYNKKNKNSIGYTYIINNIGLLYQKQKQHQKAIKYFRKGLYQDSIKEKHPSQYALLLENLAASNYLLGKKENVLQQYNRVLNIREKLKSNNELSITHINLADYYKDLDQNQKALYHNYEALKYAKQTYNNKKRLEALQNLSELTKGEQSKQYLDEYITLNDSLFQNERRLKNQFAKIRYETDKKEKENVVLKTENEKKQAEILYHKQQKTIGWLAAAIGLLLFGFSVMFYFQRRKKLLYQAQLQQVQVREHERKQIAKSLHDEVAGDLRLLHRKLEKSNLLEEAQKLDAVKENVRNLSHQLSSVSFNKVSFKNQIINLVSDYFEPDFKIKLNGLQNYNWTTVDNSIKRLLYLSTRESIQNCKKYAKASKIIINFSVHKKYVHLNIVDDGIGFDTNISKKGIGLQNLQERIEELNGTLTINSEVGKGTQTDIQIPLNGWTNKNTFS